VGADVRSEYFRYMATAGLDVRWPVLFATSSSTHILEPVAQLFVRPDEQDVRDLGIPNEDAQSFVFDATSLFDRNKFSGYDRIEGGTRANLGVRYSGTFGSGWTTNALFGQSYHLGGLNSFAAPDLVNVGAESGLETDTSDYVALVGFAAPFGLSASLSGRFDEETFEVRRTEARAAFGGRPVSVTAKYAYIQAQPVYGFDTDRHEVTVGGSVKLHDDWRVFGSGTYDIQSEFVSYNSLGFGYADECFTFALTYSNSRTLIGDTRETDDTQNIGFQLSFRTIGDFGNTSSNFLQ
jgi:LPS-assembly protein